MQRGGWGPFGWVALLAALLLAVVVAAELGTPDVVPSSAPSPASAPLAGRPRTSASPMDTPETWSPMQGARALAVRVLDDETGAAVAGADVAWPGGRGKTDAEGRAEGAPTAAGGGVLVSAPGFRPVNVTWRGEKDLTVGLTRVGMLRVRVVMAGKPAPSAHVAVSPPEPPRGATADADGVAVYAPLDRGAYAVSARSADGQWAGLAEAAVADRAHVEVVVALKPAAGVFGRVVEADGKPAAGAQVWAETEDGALLGSTSAGTDGAFALGGLAPADRARVRAIKGGRHGRGSVFALPRSMRTDAGTITLDKGGNTVAGTVLDENETPLDRVTVDLGPAWTMGESTYASTTTDAEGKFRFDDLPEGSFDLTARLGTLEGGRDGVKAGQQNVVIRILGNATLKGRVIGSSGEPVAAFSVRAAFRKWAGGRGPEGREARGPDATAQVSGSTDGRFSAGPVGRGTYDVEVTTPDGAVGRAEARVEGAGTDVGDIKVVTGGTVTGRVTGKKEGGPVSGAVVSAGARQVTSGVDGRFEVVVPAGRQSLWVNHPGYFPRRVDVREVRAGGTEDVGDVALISGNRREVEGRQGFGGVGATLRESNGNPVVEALLGDSPAARAGLMKGDVILAVDGESMHGKGVQEAIANIRGEAGSNVWLKIQRNGEEMNIPVRRESIQVPGR